MRSLVNGTADLLAQPPRARSGLGPPLDPAGRHADPDLARAGRASCAVTTAPAPVVAPAPTSVRRDQDRAAADEAAVADRAGVLRLAVVVGEDRARADVDPSADGGVAQVGQVLGLAVASQARLLGLGEVADLGPVLEHGAGAQVREGPDLAVLADRDPGADHRAGQDARARADRDAVVDVGAGGILDVDPARSCAPRGCAAAAPQRASARCAKVLTPMASSSSSSSTALDPPAGARQGPDDVGQVVLALGVLGRQPRQLGHQLAAREGVHAQIDLAQRALLRAWRRAPRRCARARPAPHARCDRSRAGRAAAPSAARRRRRWPPARRTAAAGSRGAATACRHTARPSCRGPAPNSGRHTCRAWPVPSCGSWCTQRMRPAGSSPSTAARTSSAR